jgi:hypothetical protein
MPGEPDDLDERDYRQPVTDEDVVFELGRLGEKVGSIADNLKDLGQQLEQIRPALDELSHGLSHTLRRMQSEVEFGIAIIVLGIFGILGTLRHWF